MQRNNLKYSLIIPLICCLSVSVKSQQTIPTTQELKELRGTFDKLRKVNSKSANDYLVDKLEEAKQLNNFESIRFITIQLFDYYYMARNYEPFSELKRLCVESSIQLKKDTLECQCMQGFILVKQNELEEANLAFKEVEKNAKFQQDSSILIDTYLGLAEVETSRQNLKESTQLFLESLKYAEATRDTINVIKISRRIAIEFLRIKDFERVKRYANKAEEYLTHDNKRDFLTTGLLKAGLYADMIKEFENSKDDSQANVYKNKIAKILESIIQESKETANWDVYANANYMYSRIKLKNKDYKGAVRLARTAIEYEKRPSYKFNYSMRLGYILEGSGECEKAADVLNEAKKYISPQLSKVNESYFYQNLISNEACLGRTDSIKTYISRLAQLHYELRERKGIQEAMAVESEFRTQIQADSIALLNLETQRQSANIKLQNTLILSAGIILTLLGFLLFLLRRRNTFLKENEEQKSKLFDNIAHELQTPLTLIKGFSNKVTDPDIGELEAKQLAKLINRNANYLIETTNQILSLSQLDANVNKLDYYSISLFELTKYLQNLFLPLLREKSITLNIHNQIEDTFIITDPKKLVTIYKNLIINAIKYTPKNGEISLSFEAKKGKYQFKVKDTGSGIAQSELPKIFDRFYQSKSKKSEGGFGIGLSLAKSYVELLEGTLEVESKSDIGSTFTLQLPIIEHTKQDFTLYVFPINNLEKFSNNFQNTIVEESETPEILIVEDNKEICLYLEMLLKKDYHLKFVHDGALALEFLESYIPKLIITDWMMPNIDGYELVEHLKSSSRFQTIPILMLTARSLPTHQLKALRAGVDDYIIKPLNEEVFKARVSHLLFTREKDQQIDWQIHLRSDSQNKQIDISNLDESNDWLLQLEEIILSMLSDINLNRDKVVDKMGTSLFIINSQLQKLIGLNLGSYIRELRFWEARKMLETKEYDSVKAVAFSVGFKNTKYFSRKFKERFGKYPSDYL